MLIENNHSNRNSHNISFGHKINIKKKIVNNMPLWGKLYEWVL